MGFLIACAPSRYGVLVRPGHLKAFIVAFVGSVGHVEKRACGSSGSPADRNPIPRIFTLAYGVFAAHTHQPWIITSLTRGLEWTKAATTTGSTESSHMHWRRKKYIKMKNSGFVWCFSSLFLCVHLFSLLRMEYFIRSRPPAAKMIKTRAGVRYSESWAQLVAQTIPRKIRIDEVYVLFYIFFFLLPYNHASASARDRLSEWKWKWRTRWNNNIP